LFVQALAVIPIPLGEILVPVLNLFLLVKRAIEKLYGLTSRLGEQLLTLISIVILRDRHMWRRGENHRYSRIRARASAIIFGHFQALGAYL
jgi:hypothetical protein